MTIEWLRSLSSCVVNAALDDNAMMHSVNAINDCSESDYDVECIAGILAENELCVSRGYRG